MAVAQDKRASELTAPASIADTDVFAGYRPGTGGEPNLDIRATAGLIRAPILAGLAAGAVPVGVAADVFGAGSEARLYTAIFADMPLSAKTFGAKGDGVALRKAGAVSSESAALAITGGVYPTEDDVGKRIAVYDTASGTMLAATTILAVPSPGTVTLGGNASATASSCDVIYGTDDTAALQKAADAGGMIYQPPGVYFTRKAIKLKDNTLWAGAGRGVTLVFNDRTAVASADRAGFHVGIMHPICLDADQDPDYIFPSYALNAVTAGERTVTCTTAGEAANMTEGQFVLIRHETLVEDQALIPIPLFCQATYITKIAAGVLTLADPVKEDIANAVVSPVANNDGTHTHYDWQMVRNTTLRDLSVEGLDLIAPRNGSYECVFRALEGVNTRSLISFDTTVKCLIEDITGHFWDRMLEVKQYSWGSTYRGVKGRFSGQGTPTVDAISIGEGSFDIIVDDCFVDLPSTYAASLPALTIGRCRDTTVKNSIFSHRGSQTSDPVIKVNATNLTGYPPSRNRILHCTIRNASNIPRHIHIGATGATQTQLPTDMLIEGLMCPDAPSQQVGIKSYYSSGLKIRNCIINATTPVEVDATSGAVDYDRATGKTEDLAIPVYAMVPLEGSTLPALINFRGNRTKGWEFITGIDSTLLIGGLTQPIWATKVDVEIWWTRGAGTPAGGTTVQWSVVYSSYADGAATGTSEAAAELATSAPAADAIKKTIITASVTMTTGILFLKLRRKGAATPTPTADSLSISAVLAAVRLRWRA